jgi:hypothetical protein
MWDWSNVALAIAALVGLTAGMIQLGFGIVDHGSVMKPRVIQADELMMARRYKKAA